MCSKTFWVGYVVKCRRYSTRWEDRRLITHACQFRCNNSASGLVAVYRPICRRLAVQTSSCWRHKPWRQAASLCYYKIAAEYMLGIRTGVDCVHSLNSTRPATRAAASKLNRPKALSSRIIRAQRSVPDPHPCRSAITDADLLHCAQSCQLSEMQCCWFDRL